MRVEGLERRAGAVLASALTPRGLLSPPSSLLAASHRGVSLCSEGFYGRDRRTRRSIAGTEILTTEAIRQVSVLRAGLARPSVPLMSRLARPGIGRVTSRGGFQ